MSNVAIIDAGSLSVFSIAATGEEKENFTAEALDLSLKYKFVTPLTSMVVTKPEDHDNQDGIADKPIEGIDIFTILLYLGSQMFLWFSPKERLLCGHSFKNVSEKPAFRALHTYGLCKITFHCKAHFHQTIFC